MDRQCEGIWGIEKIRGVRERVCFRRECAYPGATKLAAYRTALRTILSAVAVCQRRLIPVACALGFI